MTYKYKQQRTVSNEQSGFILPAIIVLLSIITMVSFAVMSLARTSLQTARKQSYGQMANIASKSALDWAKEAYELDENYAGTAGQGPAGSDELTMLSNSNYRVTIEVEIISTESCNSSGTTYPCKVIKGTGRVYIPEQSAEAQVAREIQETVLRSTPSTTASPLDYNPVLWVNADTASSLTTATTASSVIIDVVEGSTAQSLARQGGANASTTSNRGRVVYGWNRAHMAWGGSSWGDTSHGYRFSNVTVPQGANITDAYIQFTSGETDTGDVTLLVEGVDSDDAPQWGTADYAVDNATKTTANVAWNVPDWNNNNTAGVEMRTDSLNAVVQEIVDRSGWTSGSDMAFSVSLNSGSGSSGSSRRVAHTGKVDSDYAPELHITWETPGSTAGNGDQIAQWNDLSGNDNHLTVQFGTAPYLRTNSLDSKPIVEFNADGNLGTDTTDITDLRNAATAFIVMRPSETSSASDARFLTAQNSSENYDGNNSDSMVLFRRNGSTSTIRSQYDNNNGPTLSSAIDGNYNVYTMTANGTIGTDTSTNWDERVLKNGAENNDVDFSDVDYTWNQFYVGGRRANLIGDKYARTDIAEIIIYNDRLSDCEIEEIEDYLFNKWGITGSALKC